MPTVPLTSAQVADRLNLNVRTVNRWADKGRLPSIGRLPGATGARLFAEKDVRKLQQQLHRDALANAERLAAS